MSGKSDRNTITYIFLGLLNDIDFLRRYGECSRCWVVDGIGATIDIKTVNDSFADVASAIADPASRYFRIVIKYCRGVISLRLLASHGADYSMSFSTKASFLNSHLPIVHKLAKAQARPVGSRNRSASLFEGGVPSHRVLQTNVLPLLMSLMCVGLVTAFLLLFDRALALNLVPIADLIPVIVAATQWGIWPATLASIASTGAADFFFTTPRYSFWMDDPQEVVDLLLFVVVAALTLEGSAVSLLPAFHAR